MWYHYGGPVNPAAVGRDARPPLREVCYQEGLDRRAPGLSEPLATITTHDERWSFDRSDVERCDVPLGLKQELVGPGPVVGLGPDG